MYIMRETAPGEETAMPDGPRQWTEEIRVAGNRVVSRIKELIQEGNVRKIIIKRGDGSVVREITLTQGVAVGGLLAMVAPILAAVGTLVAFAADLRLEVVREGEPRQAGSGGGESTADAAPDPADEAKPAE
jgi:hypothetical protein